MLSRLGSLRKRVRRRLLAHRRLLAFLLTAAAVAAGLHAARPAPPQTVALTVAARDLPAGTVIAPADLTTVRVPPGGVPHGVVARPVGSTLAAPLREGEPVTDLRLVGPGLAVGHPDLVALPVRFPDAGMAGLLHVGDRVDLYATDPATARTTPVTDDALVLALPADDSATSANVTGNGVTNALGGRLVVVGVTESSVETVTAAGVGGFLTFAY
ncbi:RcpC/CpaB family pilus assembly protein [Nocardioides cheoyonin]|uniref:RcpC/CpaB family pilus assembly protein n=1 Tax=Nocardioides cheoyonin TaxID=3156615 RepID=UPI0032B5FB31